MQILVDADSRRILGATILGIEGDEAIHSIVDVMYAAVPYTVLERPSTPTPPSPSSSPPSSTPTSPSSPPRSGLEDAAAADCRRLAKFVIVAGREQTGATQVVGIGAALGCRQVDAGIVAFPGERGGPGRLHVRARASMWGRRTEYRTSNLCCEMLS